MTLSELERLAREGDAHDMPSTIVPNATILALIERCRAMERVCEAAREWADEDVVEDTTLNSPASMTLARAVLDLEHQLALDAREGEEGSDGRER